MDHNKILVIGGDVRERGALAAFLSGANIDLVIVDTEKAGLQKLYQDRPDVIIVTGRLKEGDGWQTCRRIRRLTMRPVILLDETFSERELMRALQMGADYYLSASMGGETLRLVVRSALRLSGREPQPAERHLQCDEMLLIDLQRGIAFLEEEPLQLTDTEFRLLAFFARHPNRVLTHEQILDHVWGWKEQEGNHHNVHLYISRLRQKIEINPERPSRLLTIYGTGYRLRCPSLEESAGQTTVPESDST